MKAMKNIFSAGLVFLFVLTATAVFPQEKTGSGTLKILVSGFGNDKGNAMIALCDSNECYKNTDKSKPYMGTMIPIKEGKAEWIISNLSYGAYSVSIYHDENSNGKLDKNALGIPKEKYGFSNNPASTFGPPKFEKAQFEFNKAEMIININLK